MAEVGMIKLEPGNYNIVGSGNNANIIESKSGKVVASQPITTDNKSLQLQFTVPGTSNVNLQSAPKGMDTLRIWGTDGQDTINATARGKQNVNLSVIGNGGHGDAVKATNYTDGKTYASTGEGQGDRAVAIAKGSGDANAFDAGRKGDERLNYGNTVIAETESGKAKAGSINSFDSVVSAYSTSGNARSSVENSKQMTLNATTYQDSGTATAAFEKSSHGDATVKSGSETQSKSVTTVEDSRESISR